MQVSGSTPSTCKRGSCCARSGRGPGKTPPLPASLLPFPQALKIQHCDMPLNPRTCQLGRKPNTPKPRALS